jgi:hypothetical protein
MDPARTRRTIFWLGYAHFISPSEEWHDSQTKQCSTRKRR